MDYQSIESLIPELDLEVLAWGSHADENRQLWRNTTAGLRRLALWGALGGVFPQDVRAGLGSQYGAIGEGWSDLIGTGDILICGDSYRAPEKKEILRLSDMYARLLSGASASVETYLSLVGKRESSGWALKTRAIEAVIELSGDTWSFRTGSRTREFRSFFTVNGGIVGRDAAVIAGLDYIFGGRTSKDALGRLAFSDWLFVEDIQVGVGSPLLEQFIRHKLGSFEVGLRNWRVNAFEASDVVAGAAAFERAGHSVFMDKGGKYCVVDAECVGFSRVNGKSQVAWRADKEAKISGRNLFSSATASGPDLARSNVVFRDLRGCDFAFEGLTHRVAMVASPLVEEGSGQGLGHPDVRKEKRARTRLNVKIPAAADAEIEVRPSGSVVVHGDWVVRCQHSVLLRWESVMEGVIGDHTISVSDEIVDVSVDAMIVSFSDAEKFRGFAKYRSNGGFLRNVRVTRASGEIVFDPNGPLESSVEHCIGPEEYKTVLMAIAISGGGVREGGAWRGKIERQIEAAMVEVVVERWDLEPSVFAALKIMHGDNPRFTFEGNMIRHRAFAWMGSVPEIVEVPLSGAFVGKCAIFPEQLHFLALEFPEVFACIEKSMQANASFVEAAMRMVLDGPSTATESNGYGDCLIVDDGTIVEYGDALAIEVVVENDLRFIDRIVLPSERGFDMVVMSEIAQRLSDKGVEGLVFESSSTRDDRPVQAFIDLRLFGLLTGSVSHNCVAALLRIFSLLEVEDSHRASGGWEGRFFRVVCMLRGALEECIANSSALMRRAAKTGKVAFTCRAGSTLDSSVGMNEIHLHPNLIRLWGIQAGDRAFVGRVPVPGMGEFMVCENSRVPFGTAVMNAAMKHAVEEGDVDGDSLIAIVLSPEGELRVPGNLVSVNVVA